MINFGGPQEPPRTDNVRPQLGEGGRRLRAEGWRLEAGWMDAYDGCIGWMHMMDAHDGCIGWMHRMDAYDGCI